ncbi:Tetraspanin-7 [Heracleum sosnowskyi]|uniref:Tetraspanin-7 n=1 Tax=Heracleum sosnowskyi TaxID=360622 RepID=A0AAD8JB49_9APIA|nr:Tetraspanin-7 [Heracleum sosnowskyi]
MVRFSFAITASTIYTFMFSALIIHAGLWLSWQCESFLDKPVLALGVILMVISIAGIIGFRCGVSWLVRMYLIVTFVLIVLLVCLTVFTFAVTNKSIGESLSDIGYKEYTLGDYGNWLQKRVNNDENWRKISSCLQDKEVCKSMTNAQRLTPIQSGCCKPSDSCNFTYVSPGKWTKTTTASSDIDCALWNNDPSILCFNCQPCKAGMLETKTTYWILISIFNVISVVFFIVVYCLLCLGMIGTDEDSWSKTYP